MSLNHFDELLYVSDLERQNRIKRVIKAIKEIQKDTISFQEFKDICSRYHINPTEAEKDYIVQEVAN